MNQRIFTGPNRTVEDLKLLQEEFVTYLGRDTELSGNCLTIYALPRRVVKEERPEKEKGARGKRRFERP